MRTIHRFLGLGFLLIAISIQAAAQQATVKGKITDEKGEPVIGAAVSIEGTTKGVSSDLDGNYSLQVPATGKIVIIINSLGYEKAKRSITVGESKDYTLNVSLGSGGVQLKETVVIGYGTEQKRDITGSISTIKSREIAANPVPSVDNALQGRIPGLQVQSSSGVAGAQTRVTLRGTNSIAAGGQPLFVLVGLFFLTADISPNNLGSGVNPLADINQNDIESIDVLKDAAAAAIYGSRAANGVIIITTKKGKAGITKFDAGYSAGIVAPTQILDFLSAKEHLALRDRAADFDSSASGFKKDRSNTVLGVWNGRDYTRKMADSLVAAGYFDKPENQWIPQTLRIGLTQNASLSASGGNEKTRFYISGNYYQYNSFLRGNDFDRFSAKISLDNQALKNLNLGADINFAYSINDRVPTGDGGGLGWAQQKLPYLPIYNSDGSFNDPYSNPIWKLNNSSFEARNLRTYSSVYAEISLLKSVKWRSNLGIDLTNQVEYEFNFRNLLDSASQSSAWDRRTNVNILTSAHYFTWSPELKNKAHSLQFTGGMELTQRQQDGVGIEGVGFVNDYFKRPGNAILKTQNSYNYTTGSGFLSYFLRGVYKFREKYFFNASARYDGSSKFGQDNKFGLFPAASLGWMASDEEFIKKIKVISHLKFRAGAGLTGNDNVGDFQSVGFFSSNAGYLGNGGIAPGALANPQLRWEKSVTYNAGFEVGLVRNRVFLNLDLYQRISSNMLLPYYLPTSTGYSSILINSGKMENRGVEISLTTKNIEGEFTWSTDFNISVNRNKVLDVSNQSPDNFESGQPGEGRVLQGYPVGQSYVVRFSRIALGDGTIVLRDRYRNPIKGKNGNDSLITYKAGESIYLDSLGNEMIFRDAGYFYNQRVPRGNPMPTFFGGINNRFTYNGIELSFLLYFQVGNYIYDDPAKRQIGLWKTDAQRREILDAYPNNGVVSTVPGLTRYNDAVNSDRFLYDASFIRLRNVTLAYTFPERFVNKIKLSKLRIFATGNNLRTFTRFPGWDPEVIRNVNTNSQQGNVSFSGPSYQTPQAASVIFGINFNF
ncbi:MAG: SusC/RagA family TonB-linked outer membrane protein [Bacteroidota bacterium]